MPDTPLLNDLTAINAVFSAPNSWHQGRYQNDESTCFCLAGACWHLVGGFSGPGAGERAGRLFLALSRTLHGDAADPIRAESQVINWNDKFNRTVEHVRSLIQHTITREANAHV